ncbi:hypothetical protein Dda_8451 [Drechslerella dactyloides]|uniref:Uncharacterized protein n=1 Tax=Drechslerella dactyloides TaxID=74499 RepID=A0AAD6NEU7_DREDA|nr:hypothetical protein Dda_8451 [Drechslerella dactyloides]
MVLIAPADNDTPYEPFLLEEKHYVCPPFVYPDSYTGYNTFNQLPYSEPVGEMIYSNWGSTLENATGSCFQNHPQFFQSPPARLYTDDIAPMIQVENYHQAWHDFGFNQETPAATAFTSYPDSRILLSPYGGFDYYTQYQQPAWSPSELSAASLSPPSDRDLGQEACLVDVQESSIQGEELLQGLGLYDCPELITDDTHTGSNSGQLGLGKGLKLEESFELNEEYLDSSDDSIVEDQFADF